jgi:hypothetical protein
MTVSYEDELGEALGCDEPATWDAMLTEVLRLREFESGVLIGKIAREAAKAERPTLVTADDRRLWIDAVHRAQAQGKPYDEPMSLADAIAEADEFVAAYQARAGGGQ